MLILDTTSLPPFELGTHYRALDPKKEGRRVWRFSSSVRNYLPVPGLVEPGYAVSFRDKHHHEWMRWTEFGMEMAENYWWNGCTPKYWVWPFWWGTPDFKSTRQAAFWHDGLYQFHACTHMHLSRYAVDNLFRSIINTTNSKVIASIFYNAVDIFGKWSGKSEDGEYSVLIRLPEAITPTPIPAI